MLKMEKYTPSIRRNKRAFYTSIDDRRAMCEGRPADRGREQEGQAVAPVKGVLDRELFLICRYIVYT